MSIAVLIIEDEPTLAKNMAIYLGRSDYEVVVAGSAEAGLAEMEKFRPDVVILDIHLPGMDGMTLLSKLRSMDPNLKIIMTTGHGTVENAVDAMKAGAYDFLTKPVSLAKLRILVERVLSESQRDQALSYYRQRAAAGSEIAALIGESAPMLTLRQRIQQLIDIERGMTEGQPPAVLITGETGTGKELVARAIHFSGARRDGPFVEINCAAIPSQLLESELFGHERGAFTDAKEKKIGLVETAAGGTLFLDEIGDMDLALQAKLLKLLEEKKLRRIGSVRDQSVDVRIVAATHRPIAQYVQEEKFRADLYYRLRIVELSLPPLSDRGEDILHLARHFLKLHAAKYGRGEFLLTEEAESLLMRHDWPGNVRELRNLLEQTVLMSTEPFIKPDQLNLIPSQRKTPVVDIEPGGNRLADMEREALLSALRTSDWNISKAARLLDISRDTMRYRIEKYRLEK